MAWNLHEADLPPEVKDYLSLLSSCGDERQAAEEAGVSEAEVRRWAREDVFIDHRSQALAYYDDWKDWKPATRDAAPGGFIALEDMDPSEVAVAAMQQAGWSA